VCVRGAGIENDRHDLCLFYLVVYVQVLKSIYTYRFEIISEIEGGGAASDSAADKNVAEPPDAQGVVTIRAESKEKGPADGNFERRSPASETPIKRKHQDSSPAVREPHG
jgi:hypothetical protein